MAEFKIVISDPAAKDEQVYEVLLKGIDEIDYTSEEKEKLKLPIAKINPELAKKLKLDPKINVITARIWKDKASREKINLTFKVELDKNVPENEVHCSANLMFEKVGDAEAKAEVFKAKAWQITVKGDKASRLIGLKIGDTFEGSIVGLPGVILKITGGTDNSGFPMRPDIPGPAKRRVLLSGPPGFHPREKGERRRKTVRGNMISDEIVQINTVIVYGPEESK